MSKTNLSKIKGYSPAIDSITKKLGIMPSIVFGRIWRYCQMEKQLCNTSLQNIADEMQLSYPTVLKYVKLLVDEGYLKDLTPDIKYKPHEYQDTGKAGISITASAFDEINYQDDDRYKEFLDLLEIMGIDQKGIKNIDTWYKEFLELGIKKFYTKKVLKKEKESISAKDAQNKNSQQPTIEDTINENNVLFGEEEERDKKRTDAKHVNRLAESLVKGERKRETVRLVIETEFSITPNWSNKNWSKCLSFIMDRPVEQTVDIFASWWWGEWWQGKDKQQPPRADQIMELWLQAFTTRKEQEVYSTLPKITSETKFN